MNKELLTAAKDEAAREAGYNNYDEFLYYNSDYPETITRFINRAMEIYAQRTSAKWLPLVAGSEPPIGKAVLIYLSKSGFITVGYKKSLPDGEKVWQMFGDTDAIVYADDFVSHWMPLPAEPTKNNTKP